MPTSLEHIIAATRKAIEKARSLASIRELERRAQGHIPRGFRRALEAKGTDGVAVIAELKKASPSRGLIRADFVPEQLAGELETAGASALSVLTNEEFFQGSLENLRRVSASTRLPCLRKDFIIDQFQLLEARANSADAILLIVAALTAQELVPLARRAAELGLDVLCEVHDAEELNIALDAGCEMIGVNNRDLKTFEVDLETAFRLSLLIPKNVLSVAESGIRSGGDIARLRAAGFKAFLIGESLMKSPRPGEALSMLLAEASLPISSR
ncbi:MAG: indole-3-glycerol phosphate synthase TrpC [Terriglobales bacterium]